MDRKRVFLTCAVLAALAGGCEPPGARVPVSLAEYSRPAEPGRTRYPDQTVLLHNLQRVLNADLAGEARLQSLELVVHLGGEDAEVRSSLATALGEEDAPAAVQEAVLAFLLKKDYPDLARHVVRALPRVKSNARLRDALLDWLVRHPTPEVLAEVVQLWADEVPAGVDEPRYRIVIEKISGKDWDQALLDGINAEGFFARGSALEVLSARFPPAALRQRIAEMPARTEAVAALQSFIERFDYLPRTRVEFLAAASICQTQKQLLADAARMYAQWRETYAYTFNIRDFHLLSRLAGDPLRKTSRRTQLLLELGQSIGSREHVRAPGEPGYKYDDRFATQIERLGAADLWNLYLLDQMLSTPRIQLALRIMAERDRADRASAWGGLIRYENGRAEARLYPPAAEGASDLIYVPGPRAERDTPDALCRFAGHFEQLHNADRAGPGGKELLDARLNNYYGLILTSISEHAFCAHYYGPDGIVVSLGKYPFRAGG